MAIPTTPFDPAEFLDTPAAQSELLTDAMESGDAGYIAAALGVVARARGMSAVAREAGVTREALYRALSASGDPRLTTLLGVARALGLQLTFAAAKKGRAGRRATKAGSSRKPGRPPTKPSAKKPQRRRA